MKTALTRIAGAALAVVLACLLLSACRRGGEGGQTLRWPAMGTVAQLTVRGDGAALRLQPAVQRTYARLERLLSAWDPDSELSRLADALWPLETVDAP